MKALVTGGAGFLGKHIIRRLVDADWDVVAVDPRLTAQVEKSEIEEYGDRVAWVPMNMELFRRKLMAGVILHFGSHASPKDYMAYPDETMHANSYGTFKCLTMARSYNVTAMFASTSEVYGEPLVHPQVETYYGNVNTTGPRSCYKESKRMGEAWCHVFKTTWDTSVRVPRIFNTYGPKMRIDDGRVVPEFIRRALLGEPLQLVGGGKQTRSFCYVDDTVDALMMLLDSDYMEPINIGSEEEITIAELAETILELTDSRSKIETVPSEEDDASIRRPDISLAREVLGWEPTIGLRDGLKETIKYMKQRMGV